MNWNFWPFNMGPTEGWAFLYILMAGLTMFVVNQVAKIIGAIADKRREAAAARAAKVEESPIQGDAYRTPGKVAPPRTLVIGNIPHDDDIWLIAYLRSGTDGVAQLLHGCRLAHDNRVELLTP